MEENFLSDSDKNKIIDKNDSLSEEKTFSFFFDSAGYKVFKKEVSKILKAEIKKENENGDDSK